MSLSGTSTHRHSLRLPGYDYSQAGAYFVTLCTYNRRPLFGGIHDGEMKLNSVGMMVERTWSEIPRHFPNVELGEFVVMPNHIHGIIEIISPDVEARHAVPLHEGTFEVFWQTRSGFHPDNHSFLQISSIKKVS